MSYMDGKHQHPIAGLLSKSLIHFRPGCYDTWFRSIRGHALEAVGAIQQRKSHLRPLRPGLSWTSCTCNLGPQTVCKPHRDVEDWAVGISGQLVYSNFDGTRGGMLVLHEPKLVIRLYPGDIFLFSSACITHENIPIGETETRRSLVFYTSGGLIRYVAQGFETRNQWGSTLSGREERANHDRNAGQRWLDS